MRVMLDYLDQHKGEDSMFIRNLPTALLGTKHAIEQRVPAHLKNDPTLERIRAKFDKFAEAIIRPPGGTSGPLIHYLWRNGTAALDLLKLQPGIYSEEELEPHRERNRLEKAARRAEYENRRASETVVEEASLSPTSEALAREQRAARRVKGVGQAVARPLTTPDLSVLRATVSTSLAKDSPNTKHIQDTMDDLRKDIEAAVLQRMRDSGISYTQPVALDTELQRRGLQDLVAYLLGCDASVVRHELCRLSDMCAQQRLQLDHFVCALVGAAVTLWALEPVSQGPTDPRYKALEKALQDGE